MVIDAGDLLPQNVSDLLNESDPAARTDRWRALRKANHADVPRAARSALLQCWLNEPSKPEGGAVLGIGISGPHPTLVWLIPDYQTAIDCLSDLHSINTDVAANLVQTVLELTQPAAAFFYTGARVNGYPMATLKTTSERRKVALGADIQRAADDLHIVVPMHLRIRWVEKMNLPSDRFGQPPVRPAEFEMKSATQNVSNTSALQNGFATNTTKKPLDAPPAQDEILKLPAEQPEEFYASLMDGVSDLDFFEMANLTETDEMSDALWGKTNWQSLLAECSGVYVDEDGEVDEVPCYSDIFYTVTIVDRAAFSESLREAILRIVASKR